MVFLFGKKESTGSPSKDYVPVELVQRYSAQGMNESQIMGRLRDQGFDPSQIDRALKMTLKQKVLEPSSSVSRHPQEQFERRLPEPPPTHTMELPGPAPMGEPMPQISRHPETPRGYPPERMTQAPQMNQMQQQLAPPQSEQPTTFTYEDTGEFTVPSGPEITLEEVVEGIVADKWGEFEERLTSFEKRDLQLQNQLEDVRKRMEDIDVRLREKEGTLIGRFDEFGDSMTNIEGRIGSMEKVFKEFIPQLTQNIRDMSSVIEKAK